MPTLYHGRTSVCSVKARLALAEKGIDFASRLLTLRGDQFEPGYLKLNPNAVVPTLVHDGNVVIESTVVMHYADEAFPGPPLTPADPVARTQMRMFEKLMDEYVHFSCMTLTFATANRAHLMKLTPQEMDEELAKAPDQITVGALLRAVEGRPGVGAAGRPSRGVTGDAGGDLTYLWRAVSDAVDAVVDGTTLEDLKRHAAERRASAKPMYHI